MLNRLISSIGIIDFCLFFLGENIWCDDIGLSGKKVT